MIHLDDLKAAGAPHAMIECLENFGTGSGLDQDDIAELLRCNLDWTLWWLQSHLPGVTPQLLEALWVRLDEAARSEANTLAVLRDSKDWHKVTVYEAHRRRQEERWAWLVFFRGVLGPGTRLKA